MKELSSKPNLLIIGAQKSGTTWLHQRLSAHPDIFMSRKKELQYFKGAGTESDSARLAEYYSNFDLGADRRYRGESTPNYFWTHIEYGSDTQKAERAKIPEAIRSSIESSPRLILMLRHPVGRAISAYFHHFRAGRFAHDFSIVDALEERFGVFDMGLYHRHWEIWRRSFSRSAFKVSSFDTIRMNGEGLVAEVFDWLELPRFRVAATLDRTTQKDNVGFRTELFEDGIRVVATGQSSFLLDRYRIDPERTPVVRHSEIKELASRYSEVYQFMRDEFNIVWQPEYTANDYVNHGI